MATHGEELVGFAAYDITYKDFFSPTGVIEGYRGKGIGKVLLLKVLLAMRKRAMGMQLLVG